MVWPDFDVRGHAEGRILGGQLRQRDAELLLVGLRLRLDRDLDDRLGELHALQDDRLLHVAERVAGAGVLQAGQRHDVAGKGFLDVFAVVRMHQQHAADPLLAILGRIHDRRAGIDLARINAAEGDRADEGVVHDLEGEQRERLVVVGQTDGLFLGLEIDALDGVAIDGEGR